eukprot:TRINITY_DN5091_c0_g1_i1.p1 TRINITY_DN5091_c0_g1~~TRINITY_DN5091_c0_g1_i1.p1  ORF type:complete len:1232 (-),score=264.76 TRINITY_DN5091_c0_g1_i1:19-3714(-)
MSTEEFEIRIHVIEARDLQPREKNGTSDPICYVEFNKETQHTQRFDDTLSCVWDRWFIFKAEMSYDKMADEKIVFNVFDANTIFKDTMIGSFEVNLGHVHDQDGHEMFARWVVLSDPKRKQKGIQGYLKCTVQVLGPGEMPPDHEVGEEFEEDTNGESLQSMVLLPPHIQTQEYQLAVNVYRAENLPHMDLIGSSDPFVRVQFGGASIKTKVVVNNVNPEWNTQLLIPFTMPTMANTIRFEVKDQDVDSDDFISIFNIKLDDVFNSNGPFWKNMYLDFCDKSHDEAIGSARSQISRGRLLLECNAFPCDNPELSRKTISPSNGPPSTKYILRVDVLEVHDIPLKGKINIKIKVGASASIKTSKHKINKNNVAEFYEAVPDAEYYLPEDESQVPDVFLTFFHTNITTDNQSYGYIRVNAYDAMHSTSIPQWYDIQLDPVGKNQIKEGYFPGYALARVSLQKINDASPRQPLERVTYQPYQLRAHIYQATNLTPQDQDGQNDPFCQVQVGPHKLKTNVIHDTSYPTWYETLTMDIELATDLTRASNIIIKVFDKDDWPSADDFIGSLKIRPEILSPEFDKPIWYDLLSLTGKVEGQLLLGLQLIPAERVSQFKPVPSIYPETRVCIADLDILNVTNIMPVSGIEVRNPYISTILGDNAQTKVKTETVKAKKGTALFMQRITQHLDIPIEPIFASAVSVKLKEQRIRTVTIGSTLIELDPFMPWLENHEEVENVSDLIAEPSSVSDIEIEPEIQIIEIEESDDDEVLILLDEEEQTDFRAVGILVSDLNVDNRTLPPVEETHLDVSLESSEETEKRIKIVQELETTFTKPFRKQSFIREHKAFFSGEKTLVEAGEMTYTFNIVPEEEYVAPPLMEEIYSVQELVVRVYILRGKQFIPKDEDGLADPFLHLECGSYEYEDHSSLCPDTLNPNFYKTYVFNVNLPSNDTELKISCFDKDGKNDKELIGTTEIELEERWFSEEWRNMELKPIELRRLYHPNSKVPQGSLEMWIDIMTPSEARKSPVVNIEPPRPKQWQLRAIVWNVEDVPLEHTRDFFVTGRLGNMKIQNTDIHYRSKDGKGAFNWRMIWDVIVPNRTENRFTVQVWDRNFVTPDAALAECTLNLADLFKKAERANANGGPEVLEVDRQFVSMSLPQVDGVTGAVELSIELMTEEYAMSHPIGKGRDGLPEVDRPPPPWDIASKFKAFGQGSKKFFIIAGIVVVVVVILSIILGAIF